MQRNLYRLAKNLKIYEGIQLLATKIILPVFKLQVPTFHVSKVDSDSSQKMPITFVDHTLYKLHWLSDK